MFISLTGINNGAWGEKCPNTEFFSGLYFLYAVRTQTNKDQKKNPYRDTFHTLPMCKILGKDIGKHNLIHCGFAQMLIIFIYIVIIVPFCFIELYSYTEENDFQENVLAFEVMLVEYNKDSKNFI